MLPRREDWGQQTLERLLSSNHRTTVLMFEQAFRLRGPQGPAVSHLSFMKRVPLGFLLCPKHKKP